jgi:hypothetical protein
MPVTIRQSRIEKDFEIDFLMTLRNGKPEFGLSAKLKVRT